MGRASDARWWDIVFLPWRSSISLELCVPGPMYHRSRATCHSRAKDTCSQAGYDFSMAADGIRGAASLPALCPRPVFACQQSQAAPFEFLQQSWKVSALVDPRMPAQLAHILVNPESRAEYALAACAGRGINERARSAKLRQRSCSALRIALATPDP